MHEDLSRHALLGKRSFRSHSKQEDLVMQRTLLSFWRDAYPKNSAMLLLVEVTVLTRAAEDMLAGHSTQFAA